MEKAKGKKLFYRPAGKRKGMYTPTQIICASFVIVIALGTFLLSLPVASKHGRLDVLDAMFTATSATCVTGLIVRDTWTQFTYFGQAVILLLIQVGGLGLVTLTSFFALAMRRRMGFRDLRLLGESVSADGYAQAKDVLKIVVGLAGLFEGIGIVLLLFAFVPQFGLEGIWVSVFTAISAFCNAGFDLFGRFGQYSSLAPYVNNYYVQAVVMFMIISGGLGFMVWVEIGQYRKKHRLSLQAKVVLSFSVILWLGGAALIALMEWNNPASMGGLSRAAVHWCGTRLYRRRREGDYVRCDHPDDPQCGSGSRRLCDRRAPHRVQDGLSCFDHYRARRAGGGWLGCGGVL